MVHVRKMAHIPHKCNKCAEYRTHQAKDCKAIIDICTCCAGGHKTNECEVTDPNLFRCPNCKLLGHKAADPNCQAYNKLEDLARRFPDDKYLYFTTSEPSTWAQQNHNNNGIVITNMTYRNDNTPVQYTQYSTPPQKPPHNASRQGPGLALSTFWMANNWNIQSKVPPPPHSGL